MHISYEPVIPLWGIYPEVIKMYVNTETCIHNLKLESTLKPSISEWAKKIYGRSM